MANINKIINGCDYTSRIGKYSYFTLNGYNICEYLDEDKFNTVTYLRKLEEDLDNARENRSFRRGTSNHSEHFKFASEYKNGKIHSDENMYNDANEFIMTLLIILIIFGLTITTIKIIYEL